MRCRKDIERIRNMEALFDEVSAAFHQGIACSGMAEKVRLLTAYMDGGQWLKDYEADERGELPQDLKRGVLSQDGLYNLLTEIEEYERYNKTAPEKGEIHP